MQLWGSSFKSGRSLRSKNLRLMNTRGWQTFSGKGQRVSVLRFAVQNGLYGNYSTLLLQCNHTWQRKPQARGTPGEALFTKRLLNLPCGQVVVCQPLTRTLSTSVTSEVRAPTPLQSESPVGYLPPKSLNSLSLTSWFQTASFPHPSCLFLCPWHSSVPSTPCDWLYLSLPTRMSAHWGQIWSVLFITLF